MRLLGQFVNGDIGFWTEVNTRAAFTVQIVQTFKAFLQIKCYAGLFLEICSIFDKISHIQLHYILHWLECARDTKLDNTFILLEFLCFISNHFSD